MIIVINNGNRLSPKMRLVINVLSQKGDKVFYVSRKFNSKFEEEWGTDYLYLANSLSSVIAHIFLMFVKNPISLHDGILRRIYRKQDVNVLFEADIISTICQALAEYFDKPTKQKNFIRFLKNNKMTNFFLIDESVSIRLVDLKTLKKLGKIIYISQDVAYDRYSFGKNVVTKSLMYRLEHDAVKLADVVVACSERDRLKYIEMGAKNVVFYPNIYPISEYDPSIKNSEPTVSIVLKTYWGPDALQSLNKVLKALTLINKKIDIQAIGMKPNNIQKNYEIKHFNHISQKIDFLRILSNAWIGINIGVHPGGTNERKYDYAMAGLVVFSDFLGSRGDLLPYEYVYMDYQDLAAKLKQILDFDKETLKEMGLQNRKYALNLAEKQQRNLADVIKKLNKDDN